jgi:hypothetical protein
MGLLDNAAIDDLTILHGDLAGDIEPAARLHGTGEGQVLAARPGLFRTITFDRHEEAPLLDFLKGNFTDGDFIDPKPTFLV